MAESTRSGDNRAARLPQPPKVVKKISTADAGFLSWLNDQEPAVEWEEGKKKYLVLLNAGRKEAYEQKLKDYQSKVNQSKDESLAPEQNSPITSTLLNNLSPATIQTSPEQSSTPPQSISAIDPSTMSPLPQVILPPQSNPLQNSPSQVMNVAQGMQTPSPLARPVAPPGSESQLSLRELQQIREMMEALRARTPAGGEKAQMVEAQPVVPPRDRLDPLSFLTLSTVEGIVGGTNPSEIGGQTTWEEKMEKFMRLSHSYSTSHTISGETCYLVDKALYEHVLLAVAARKQNEQMVSNVVSKMQEHIGHMESSCVRVAARENEAVEGFVQILSNAQLLFKSKHRERMEAVLKEIKDMQEALTSSLEDKGSRDEMQRLKHQVEQYELVIPIYKAQLEEAHHASMRLGRENQEQKLSLTRVESRLAHAESLILNGIAAQETLKHQSSAAIANEGEQSVQQEGPQSKQPESFVVDLVDSSPEQNVDQSKGAEADVKMTAPSTARMINLTATTSKPEEANGKRSRSQGNAVADKEQPSAKRPSQMDSALEQQPARRGRNPEREKEIETEVLQSYQRIKWTHGYDQDHWFCDLRNVYKPPEQLVAASRKQVLAWKEALGKAYYPLRSSRPLVSVVERIEDALKTFENVVAGKNLVCWITRACAKHENTHSMTDIPRLIVRDGDPETTRACPLKYYYEQLLEDLKHVVAVNFEPVKRTILEPIPKTAPSPAPGPRPTQGSAPTKGVVDNNAWKTQRSTRRKKTALVDSTYTADHYFQDLAKDIHEQNKSIPNVYEHLDTEQYNWAFDIEMDEQTKELVKRTKRLIALVKDKTPPDSYRHMRARKLPSGSLREIREYDEQAIWELEQYLEDLRDNNADKCILGYYEDRTGAVNLSSSDGPSGQGTR